VYGGGPADADDRRSASSASGIGLLRGGARGFPRKLDASAKRSLNFEVRLLIAGGGADSAAEVNSESRKKKAEKEIGNRIGHSRDSIRAPDHPRTPLYHYTYVNSLRQFTSLFFFLF